MLGADPNAAPLSTGVVISEPKYGTTSDIIIIFLARGEDIPCRYIAHAPNYEIVKRMHWYLECWC